MDNLARLTSLDPEIRSLTGDELPNAVAQGLPALLTGEAPLSPGPNGASTTPRVSTVNGSRLRPMRAGIPLIRLPLPSLQTP